MDGSKAGMSHREREREMMIYWALEKSKIFRGGKRTKRTIAISKTRQTSTNDATENIK